MKDEIMIDEILSENERRQAVFSSVFDPETGRGAPGRRFETKIDGIDPRPLWLPVTMRDDDVAARLIECGSVSALLREGPVDVDDELSLVTHDDVRTWFDRLRCRHDFAYWAAKYIYVKCKGGGANVLLRLTYPQRRFVEMLEDSRVRGIPIRVVMLKARQWGGSTTSQMYMAWLQLVHNTGLNSLIIAHQGTASDEIKDMFDRALDEYPLAMLYPQGADFSPKEKKMVTVGKSGSTFRVPQRNCKIKIGSSERPHSCRGADYNLVHLSEVGLWKATDGKQPEEIVRSACSGVVYSPETMIVYESTANGVGNFFHREYLDARDNPKSQFSHFFVPWYHIEINQLPFADSPVECVNVSRARPSDMTTAEFARRLYDNREVTEAPSSREEPGRYLWWLWQKGATLEAINWYITERTKHSLHGSMAAECPTDDTEAFVNSGAAVFDKYKVEALRTECRPAPMVGEITADIDMCGSHTIGTPDYAEWIRAFDDLRFEADSRGCLSVWELPAGDDDVSDRYLTVVDIGGRSYKADWSVIAVFDRAPMIEGGVPRLVAQWYGHIDIDLLAWKSAQIAAYYNNALLVIESNTLETHDIDRMVDGDQSLFILNQIKRVYSNLYARNGSEEDIRMGRPIKYGFHTNISTKPMIISTLVKVVREGLYVERDERCLDEYLVYERKPNGAYGAVSGAHDDLLMTRAIGMHICYFDMEPPRRRSPLSSMMLNHNIVSEASI